MLTRGVKVPLLAIPRPDDDEGGDDPRISPPYDINPDWMTERQKAKRWELAFGIGTYLTVSWEGRLVVLAIVAGLVGGFYMLRAMLNF
jgi:hypothetical protein